ncbi:galectin-8 [Callorhinchus milii]|uniref:Galectin n=1 Tax=Callorhinchus milii TaxID=7868 RepID=V9L9T8_CALMI|nr:galectin-8 [Callorhinchus milii]|eukprot:gi/632976968/ref/XP_007905084.1/ PREDICTED: galectin-9-like [Callorhinchus milii]
MSIEPQWCWNPETPFTKQFPVELKQDMMIVMCGKVPSDAKSFVINFQKGEGANVKIPFQLGVCFQENSEKFMFSSKESADWEPMQDRPISPSIKGTNFKLTFLVWSNCFQVALNAKHILKYNHNERDWKADGINVYGDLQVKDFTVYDIDCKKKVNK